MNENKPFEHEIDPDLLAEPVFLEFLSVAIIFPF